MSLVPTTTKGRLARQKILETAASLFHQQGCAATSVDQILQAAEACKSQFYHYFPSKECLIGEVLEFHGQRLLEKQRPLQDQCHHWEGLELWFRSMVESYSDLERQLGCPVGTLAGELAARHTTLQQALESVFRRWLQPISEAFLKMKRSGRLREDVPADDLALFCGEVIQGGLLFAKTEQKVDPLKVALRHLMAYLRSLAPRAC
ncbi:MAG: TetR/AcrR family transcriptional regulator [Planctomycetota bacterium]|nr:MAG: TetR/AcrR family transcriptional regulator [Planctomycetota bacterium]